MAAQGGVGGACQVGAAFGPVQAGADKAGAGRQRDAEYGELAIGQADVTMPPLALLRQPERRYELN